MKNLARVSILASALLTVFSAHAAKQAELKVTGVISPPSCDITLGANGIVDYGVISPSSLSRGAYTRHERKDVSFAITCNAKIRMALKTIDNRASSVVSGVSGTAAPDDWIYGLGTVGASKVGGYMMFMPRNVITTDNEPATQIFSVNGGAWIDTGAVSATTGSGMLGKDRRFSWAAAGTTVPFAAQTVSGTISVRAYLNKPENLPLTQDVPLDGSATLEVLYL